MQGSKLDELALNRTKSMLDYVEQLIRLDETVARKLNQYRLADGTLFALHQHELNGIPGLHYDEADEDGPIWLRIERLIRTRPPEPTPNIAEWIVVSTDPDKTSDVTEIVTKRVTRKEKDRLVEEGTVFSDEARPAMNDEPDRDGNPQYYDLTLTLDRRPTVREQIDIYRSDNWASWAETERPRRKSIFIYQKLFTIAQLLNAGNPEQSELVWGIGLSKWKKSGADIELPLISRNVEIQIVEDKQAEIVIRPRDLPSQIEIRAFQELATVNFNATEDAARRSIKTIEVVEPDGVSPFRPETFEPVLKICAGQLDSEGHYLPDHKDLPSSEPVPDSTGEILTVSDRFVIFARRRTMNVLIADIERLKATLVEEEGSEKPKIEGAARTLVLGPSDGLGQPFVPLGDIGTLNGSELGDEPDHDDDHGDLFFPKPFNEDQVNIIRRLENSDGVVVQGPPGTGKTHTIANVICHMLATGKRVLVISHGEAALAVVRDQLPEKIRDLAISVTSSDRDGNHQVENAVTLMLRIVNDFSTNQLGPRRRIAGIETKIVQDREKLKEIDLAITKIAGAHFRSVPGSTLTPYDFAKKLMADRNENSWFLDRPSMTVSQAQIDPELISSAIVARQVLGEDLQYIDALLPSGASLPDVQTLELWRADLLRAREIESNSSHTSVTRKLVATIGVPAAEELLAHINTCVSSWERIGKEGWANKILYLGLMRDDNFLSARDYLESLVSLISNIGERTRDFVVRGVSLPEAMPIAEDIRTILKLLGEGKNPFGLFSLKNNKFKPVFEQMLINGDPATSAEDWRHISKFVALNEDIRNFQKQWNSLSEALGIEVISSKLTFSSSVRFSQMLPEALDLPRALQSLNAEINEIIGDQARASELTANLESLIGFSEALTARLSQTRLAAIKVKVMAAVAAVPKSKSPLNEYFVSALEHLADSDSDSEQLLKLWDAALQRLEDIRSKHLQFELVRESSTMLSMNGAPLLGEALKIKASSESEDYIAGDWQKAWDWWAHHSFLNDISAREELGKLHVDRIDTENRLRDNFAELVRERAFYALAGSMPGPAKSALKAFSDLVRKLGKGKGKKAAMHRRELRSAMHQCFNVVPCWIMPAWRVSEQLPSEMGSFDLVILDEASQSDAKELPALLRGKKVLIVGDDRQVSPTDAFIRQEDIERLRMNYLKDMPFPSHLLPGTSIYELARVMFPDKYVMLREHFRCVEPIIRFSMQFYSEPLIPLRVPTAHERMDPPLIDILVKDGERHPNRKINELEACVIVDEIAKIVEDPATSHIANPIPRPRTIGVVSLIGNEQSRHIQQLLIEKLGELKFVEHRIICGDSATMQGNERDIVFLSMVTGSQGRIGAQTADQYKRRFNVALSRAKDRMVLVRSVEEHRLNPNDLKSKVIQHFREPMPSSPKGVDGNLGELCQSGFEREFFEKLTELGYSVRPQVGSLGYSIDLVVEGTNGRRLAIECDGDLYHGPDKWADDMRRQRILERVGWKFWRVFGSSYTLNPDAVFEDLLNTLDAQGITPSNAQAVATKWTEHKVLEPKEISVPTVPGDIPIRSKNNSVEPDANSHEKGVELKIGDRIVLQFIDQANSRPTLFEVVAGDSNLQMGRLGAGSALAKTVAGVEIGEEFVFRTDKTDQNILYVAKQSADEIPIAAE